jgi:hypothetical protein
MDIAAVTSGRWIRTIAFVVLLIALAAAHYRSVFLPLDWF